MMLPRGWYKTSEISVWLLSDKLDQAIGRNHVLYGQSLRIIAHEDLVNSGRLLCWHPNEENLYTLLQLSWAQNSSELCHLPPIVEMQGSFQDFLDYTETAQQKD
ncbi:hypothetical protein [Oceanospirillum sediminis]|uniref:Uncharacterized protein n=1 Tax=Oceanospirillum sediminis TaxID=2760088 RepID=A0A839INU2_9GAMM|nr:hypothetical protein [Oceanospirillum sediminis]MBB1486169.1 hypothetical protein [Oceanospirillum sediminis]